jgi:hypothetical protein
MEVSHALLGLWSKDASTSGRAPLFGGDELKHTSGREVGRGGVAIPLALQSIAEQSHEVQSIGVH